MNQYVGEINMYWKALKGMADFLIYHRVTDIQTDILKKGFPVFPSRACSWRNVVPPTLLSCVVCGALRRRAPKAANSQLRRGGGGVNSSGSEKWSGVWWYCVWIKVIGENNLLCVWIWSPIVVKWGKTLAAAWSTGDMGHLANAVSMVYEAYEKYKGGTHTVSVVKSGN